MTTIVWDGKILAADGRCTKGNVVASESFVKIHTSNGVVRGSRVICYSLAGRADLYDRIGDWIGDGCPQVDEFLEAEFSAIIITEDGLYEYGEGSHDLVKLPDGDFSTLGSGGEFAHSALVFGKNAIEAVQHAASIDLFSGGNGMYIDCRCDHPELKEFKV